MNRKGFTLIELLAVIILIALVATLLIPTAMKSLNESKQKSYDMFIENVKTAAANYYMECENGNTTITCTINSNTITTTLGSLATYGFLKGTSKEDTSVLNVLDPKTGEALNECGIKITKNIDESEKDSNNMPITKVTYSVEKNDNRDECPRSY